MTNRMRKCIRDEKGLKNKLEFRPQFGPGRVPELKKVLTDKERRNLTAGPTRSNAKPLSTSTASVQTLETHRNNEANQKWGTRKSWGSQTSLRPGSLLTGARIKAVGSKPSWESKDAGFSKISLSGLVENKGRLLSGETQGPAPPTADWVCPPCAQRAQIKAAGCCQEPGNPG